MSWKVLRRNEEGQTMAEYAVVLGLITPALVLMLGLFGRQVAAGIERVANLIP